MNTIKNAPALKLDKVLYKDGKVPVHVVRERRIVWNLFYHLLRNGFWTPDEVFDGDEYVKVSGGKAAMELIFNLDEAHIVVSNVAGQRHNIFLVLGNDTDIVSDWNYSEGDPDGFNAVMEKFDAEAFA